MTVSSATPWRSGLLPPPPPLPADELASEDGDEAKGLCNHKVSHLKIMIFMQIT